MLDPSSCIQSEYESELSSPSCHLLPLFLLLTFHNVFIVLLRTPGRGKDRRTIRNPNQAYSNNTGDAHSPHNHSHREEKEKGDIKCRDYIASDMFGALVDIEAKKGIVCGFLSAY